MLFVDYATFESRGTSVVVVVAAVVACFTNLVRCFRIRVYAFLRRAILHV